VRWVIRCWLVNRIGEYGLGMEILAERNLLGGQIDGEPAVGGGFKRMSEPLLQGGAGGGALDVIVDSGKDRPWSQYFCCMVGGNRDFVRKHPVATKRALRAILKASNLCALEPQRAARLIADRGYDYDYSLETLKDIPYDKWRDYDAEDSVRFYALRLQEAGMIKSSPQKIIAKGTDFRFLNELRKELKA